MAMTPEATKAIALDVAHKILRNWWTVIAGAALGLSAALLLIDHIPKVYEAKCTIFVAPQKLPTQYVQLTEIDDMNTRINAIADRVLSRPYLQDLVAQLAENVPAYQEPTNEDELERAIRRIQRGVRVVVRRNARLFYIGYHNEHPRVAAFVVNHLAQRYIEENVQVRIERGEETLETLEALLAQTRAKLDEKERAVTMFKQAHMNAIDDSLTSNLKQIDQKQKEWELNERKIERLSEDIDQLKIRRSQALAAAEQGVPTTFIDTAPADPGAARLATLQAELAGLKQRYTAQHPQVLAKQRELDEFMAGYVPQGGGQVVVDDNGETVAAAASPIDQQINSKQRELNRLTGQSATLLSQIDTLNARIKQTPHNDLELSSLMKGLDILDKQYKAQLAKVENARLAGIVEENRGGENFEIIEPARVPRTPVKPQPMLIFAMGVGIGLALFVGPIIARCLLAPVINSEALLRDIADTPIVFSVPRIPTTGSMRGEFWRRFRNFALGGASMAFLSVVVLYVYKLKDL